MAQLYSFSDGFSFWKGKKINTLIKGLPDTCRKICRRIDTTT